jgi:hypothetical protein
MTTLMTANRQWATRPPEERYTTLTEMSAAMHAQRAISRAAIVSSRRLRVVPDGADGLLVEGPNGHGYAPTHWALGQMSSLVGAPASYLRTLPAPVAADCLNYGLQVERSAQDVGVLLSRNGAAVLRAATGPRYGRIWNTDVVDALVDRFGNGVTGDFRVPGIWGESLSQVTKGNTTLYAGDRDMFVFLADERNRIELPGRRDGQTGTLARGFFVSNSEVGAGTLRVKTFLFDYVCANRIVWGAHEVEEIAIRHTASAPDRFVEEVAPALLAYSQSAASGIERVLASAQRTKVDKVEEFLARRFGPKVGQRVADAHLAEEGRPIETVWDVVTGATAYAKAIPWTADRVEFEAQAGSLLDTVEA